MQPDLAVLPPGRQQEILRRALGRGVLRVRQLAVDLGVHEMTVRRDLDTLTDLGLLERMHGGARLRRGVGNELAHHLRASANIAAKEAIARAALDLIVDGDTVALDASTTALALARVLHARRVSAIVTGLDAANVLAATGVPFMLPGGSFHAPARSFTGAFFLDRMHHLHPDKVFFSAMGFTPETGFTDAHVAEVGAKQALLRAGGTAIVLLDATKFGARFLATIANVDAVSALLTNREPPKDCRNALVAGGVRVTIAPEEDK